MQAFLAKNKIKKNIAVGFKHKNMKTLDKPFSLNIWKKVLA